jgi:hypothetical protein
MGPEGIHFCLEVSWMKKRAPVRQNAPAFWTPKAPRRGEDRPKAIRINLSGRAIFQRFASALAGDLRDSQLIDDESIRLSHAEITQVLVDN